MLVIVNVAYLVYGAAFTAIKWSRSCHIRRLPVAISRCKGLRSAGLLREERPAGPVLRWDLVAMDERPA